MNVIELTEPFDNVDVLADGIYEYCEINNVIKIESQFNKYTIHVGKMNSIDVSYYMCIDTLYNDAFGHWVYESGIYLPLFLKIKQKYPSLKLYLNNYKNYKKIFCNYFDINDDDVVYDLHNSNICIVPLPISSININKMDQKWELQVDYFLIK